MNLGERIKKYESEYDIRIPKNKYIIIRLDGKNFSTFTRGFHKPFDTNFIKAMNYTQMDLLNHFPVCTTYSHSDEITVIFDKQDQENHTHFFDGRIQKIITCLSSYCSVKFNYHLCKIMEKFNNTNYYTKEFLEEIKNCSQIFDARIIAVENKYEVTNHQIWRSVHDCERNALSSYGHFNFSKKILHKKNGKEIIEMLKNKGIDWHKDVPLFIKNGIYCKKILYDKIIEGNVENTCKRTKCIFKYFRIEFGDEITDLLLAKYWDNKICNIGEIYKCEYEY